MNKHFTFPLLTSFLLALFLAALFAAPALAADGSCLLPANAVWDFASDRARMIQISLVVVAIGCAIMWWYR